MILLNGQRIQPTMFPDKTSQVWKINMPSGIAQIMWEFESEAELMHVAQLTDLVTADGGMVDLHMTYLPYARQDKEVANDKTFALNTFARLINAMGFRRVTADDPHSEVAADLIHRFMPIYRSLEVHHSFAAVKADLVCYPDAGAAHKYKHMISLPWIEAAKERDQLTGKISSCVLIGDGDVRDRVILIVDDICDGGATFIGIASSLYARGAKEVHLHVTHGIFSRGLDVLKQANIKRIFTAKGEQK